MGRSLDDILENGTNEAPETVTPEVAEPIVTEAPKGEPEVVDRPRDPATGKFAPKAADKAPDAKTKDAAPPAAEKNVTEGQLSAVLAEREKRQAAERRAAELERKLQPQTQPKAPDLYEDPDKFRAGMLTEVQQTVLNERLNMSEMMVRSQFEDADPAIAAFMEASQANPAMRAQVMQQPHPYKAVYDEGKRILAMQEIGDPVAYKEKLRAELMAELGQQPAAVAQPVQLPTSLANARSAAPRNATTWQGPTPINDILARKR